ncbi:hypothetical protein CEXT_159821 [Caerostris extrusa]|uniref:Uncharacterized protein n=1 Tax=Caerostris extrusa TaxID=172846 RepID=A0AAV4TSJ0_CAEEX|nr:hypothetical protein CEXT_159821 [Caerostris extrusa]
MHIGRKLALLFTKEPQILEMKLCRSPTRRERWRVREQLNGTRTSFPVICSSVNGISFPHRRTDQWMFVFPRDHNHSSLLQTSNARIDGVLLA